jgi:hypothetical protein
MWTKRLEEGRLRTSFSGNLPSQTASLNYDCSKRTSDHDGQPDMHSVQMSGSAMSLPTQHAQPQTLAVHLPAAGIGLPLVCEQVH